MSPPLIFEILVQQQQQGGDLEGANAAVASQYATYSILVDWLGTPVTGAGFNDTYDDLVAEAGHGVKSVRIKRGRDDNLSDTQAGTATIVLHDPDGLYNPSNAASPLAANLVPLKPVWITASNVSTSANLFYGYIRSIEHDPHRDVQETRIECVDGFAGLARSVVTGSLSGALTTTSIVSKVISAQTWELVGPATLATGISIGSTWYPSEGASGLDEIQKALEVERGVFYMNAGGRYIFEARATRTGKTSSATIADTMQALRPGVDLDRIANRARVTRTGGEQQVANDATSQAAYGIIDVGDIESPNLANDAAALTLAQYLVAQLKDPRSPMYAFELMNRDVTTMDQILARELQDRITVTDSLGGTSGDYHIEGIEHEITDGGKFHRCNWTLSARGAGTQTGSVGVVGSGGVILPPPTVTYLDGPTVAFPASPSDRDEVYYVADATNGIVWHFRYRSASASAYKWECVGGSAMRHEVASSQSTASTTYVDLGTAGPTVTVPLEGDYEIHFGADLNNAGANYSIAAVKIGAAATADTEAIFAFSGSASGVEVSVARTMTTLAVAASTALKVQYKAGAGTLSAAKRFMFVRPIRVTG